MRLPALLAFSLLASALAAQAPPRPAVTGIAFMRVYTDDLPAAEHFYSATMGYDEKRNGDERVFPINLHQWIEVVPSAQRAGQSYMASIGFTVSDVDAMRRYLLARGVTGVEAPQPGLVEVHDPEGNLICFVQRNGPLLQSVLARKTPLSARAASHHIIHVGMIVHDAGKEDAFWRDVLGFRPYWHGTMHPGRTDWISLQVPDGTDWIEYMLSPPNLRSATSA